MSDHIKKLEEAIENNKNNKEKNIKNIKSTIKTRSNGSGSVKQEFTKSGIETDDYPNIIRSHL